MNKTYLFLASLLILLGAGLAFFTDVKDTKEIPADRLLAEYNENTRYITTDALAHRMIEGDPSVMLVDVRAPAEAADFMLPGAVNMPIKQLLADESMKMFQQDQRDVIFYSNGDVAANQAWMMMRRLGYKRLYVLKGGLNEWVETILQPTPPLPGDPVDAFDLYRARLGAGMFFKGTNDTETTSAKPAGTINLTRKSKTKKVEGGC